MLETKWLISIRIERRVLRQPHEAAGSDGVAPEVSSITPAAAVSRASRPGAPASMAGRKSRSQPIRLPVWRRPGASGECDYNHVRAEKAAPSNN